MTPSERLALGVFHRLDPETAHDLSLKALRFGLVRAPRPVKSPRLHTNIAGIALPNPVGLAAGYDKNAQAMSALLRLGFGFIEAGAATPRPQPGNPKPRLFRLDQDRAAINRFGFNNDGIEAIGSRLRAPRVPGAVGLNLGANKDSENRVADYITVLKRAAGAVDFVTLNVSSPNTEKLRDLQGKAALSDLVAQVIAARDGLPGRIPVFLKVAPDLSDAEVSDIAAVAASGGIDALIATNTTLDRSGLQSDKAGEKGGLSGKPLFQPSTRILGLFAQALGNKVPLIGVGGISSATDAYTKIKAGASAVQIYTALVYSGFSLLPEIVNGLDQLLERDGFQNISEAVGIESKDYA